MTEFHSLISLANKKLEILTHAQNLARHQENMIDEGDCMGLVESLNLSDEAIEKLKEADEKINSLHERLEDHFSLTEYHKQADEFARLDREGRNLSKTVSDMTLKNQKKAVELMEIIKGDIQSINKSKKVKSYGNVPLYESVYFDKSR